MSGRGRSDTSSSRHAAVKGVKVLVTPTVGLDDLLGRGWTVIPVNRTKKPLIAWKEFQQRKPSAAELTKWRLRNPPAWAVVTGQTSGVITLDFNGKLGCELLRELHLTPHRRTGSGGFHVDFCHPGSPVRTLNGISSKSLGRKYPGLDIRGDGGYAIVLGENSAGRYEWLREPEPDSLRLLPGELIRCFTEPCAKGPSNGRPRHTDSEGDQQRGRILAEAVERARDGRNAALFWMSCRLRDLGVTQPAAEHLAHEFRRSVPDTNTKGQYEPFTTRETVDTVRSAYRHSSSPESHNLRAGSEDTVPQQPAGAGRQHTPSQFELKEDGLYYGYGPQQRFLCARLSVTATMRSYAADDWAQVLDFVDRDGIPQTLVMPLEIAAEPTELYRMLVRRGLLISEGSQDATLIARYVHQCNPPERRRSVDRIGWHGQVFVLPEECWGASEERVMYTASLDWAGKIGTRGTLQDWRDRVGHLCAGNSRLIFAVSCGFTGPLLTLLGEPGGGFHLHGTSSSGKTTALRVAGSVCGGGGVNGYVDSWRATGNGLEALAAGRNHLLLCLDEIGQAEPEVVAECAYALANGFGKQRMTKSTEARRRTEWTVLCLSTGEVRLAEYMRESARKTYAGQEIRFCSVPADGGQNMGVFEDLHDFPSAAALARHFTDVSSRYYGTPLREYLRVLTENRTECTAQAKASVAAFEARLPYRRSGELCRAISRFACVGAAGELASAMGITGWKRGTALNASQRCFNDWLSERGTFGALDDLTALRQVRSFLQLHGSSRFPRLADSSRGNTPQRAGFVSVERDGTTVYLIHIDAFRDEVCRGLDHRRVALLLRDRGYLKYTKGRLTDQRRVPEIDRCEPTRFYAVWSSILAARDEDV